MEMKPYEFAKRYNLHDSLLESIEVNEVDRTAKLIIDFCYWQQPGYRDGNLETGIIALVFSDLKILECDNRQIDSDEIVECKCIDENTLSIYVESDVTDDCHSILISAGDISIMQIEEMDASKSFRPRQEKLA